ncbi:MULTISPECIES: glycosyltransferase [Mammaliicoccus]|uniref:glycosyltransferase n=1 Tax=Mammaliicoccus TaxID=2803850 RepID=UPI001EFA2B06|nr:MULTISPECIES: glycosyltransferase [Mammaliicoccus]MEB8067254.1 glycosyltransferase [Mammaliicoccus fleurettii]
MLYTITSILPKIHGGRTKSLLYRIKFLEEHLNQKSVIHTTNYNPDYFNVYDDFKKRNIISDSLEIKNIYEWLSNDKLLEKYSSPTIFTKKKKETEYTIEHLNEKINKNIVRYYNKDEYVLYRKFYFGTKILLFEDFMSPISSKRLERREYTRNGVLHRITNYSPTSYNKLYEEYYNKVGYIYLKKYYSDVEKNKILYITFYQGNRPAKFFRNEKEMFTYYFNNVLEDDSIVFNDARLLDKSLIECDKNLKRVAVFHSTHLVERGIRGSYKLVLNSDDIIDKYIVLTDYQKKDIQKDFEIEDDKFKVIPHFVEKMKSHEINEKNNQFCYVGRISKEKQIDHIIKAFSIYISKGNDSKLLIYGKDENGELNSLKILVKELNLNEYVEFKGYTSNPEKVFENSIASILTSKFEGFGLTIMESLNNGCPVLSYNIKYGSSELIENNKNGILVEKDNIDELATAMENARNIPLKDVKLNNRFSLESAINNYQNLLDELKY